MHIQTNRKTKLANQNQDTNLFDIAGYWMILLRNKWLILFCGLFCLALASLYAAKSVPIYQASVKIQADPTTPSALSGGQNMMSPPVFLFYETQYEIIQSRTVAEAVVKKLDLVNRYKQAQLAKQNQPQGNGIISQIKGLKTKLATLFGQLKADIIGQPIQESKPSPRTDEQIAIQLAQKIQSGLKVKGGRKSQMIDISYQSDNPELATEIVNTVADAYISFGLQTRLSQIKDTASWLSEQLTELKQNLKTSEDKLQAYKKTQGLVDTQQQQQIANTQLSNLNTELIKAQTQHAAAQELYTQAMQAKNKHNGYLSLSPVMQNSSVKALVSEEARLSNRVIELSKRYGEKHPKMVAARSDLNSTSQNLQREAEKVVSNIEKQYRLTQLQVTNIEKLIRENKQNLQSLQGNNYELGRLEREVEENRRVYDSFVTRLMEADVSGDYEASNIKIIDKATQPKRPIKPNVKAILAAGLFVGLVLGVLVALLRASLERSFHTPEHVENKLKISGLGITQLVKNFKKEGKPEVQYLTNNRSTFAESINTIRTGILFSEIENPPKVTLVTSSSGSEGKSTLAVNLALAFSQLDKTLLLELDLRKPSISDSLKLTNPLGMREILSEGVSHQQAICQLEGEENLDIIHAGSIPNNPLELISSTAFRQLLQNLKQVYTHIIIDSPPILPVSDAGVLAQLSDSVILAVRAERTSIKNAQESVKRLNKLNANIAGGVLTAAEPKKMSYYGESYHQAEYYGYQAT